MSWSPQSVATIDTNIPGFDDIKKVKFNPVSAEVAVAVARIALLVDRELAADAVEMWNVEGGPGRW